MGLIMYSSGHISGPREQISTKFGLWMFFYHASLMHGIQNAEMKKKKLWRHHVGTLNSCSSVHRKYGPEHLTKNFLSGN